MTFWQKNKWKIIAPVLIVLVLAAAFVFGDRNMPKQKAVKVGNVAYYNHIQLLSGYKRRLFL